MRSALDSTIPVSHGQTIMGERRDYDGLLDLVATAVSS